VGAEQPGEAIVTAVIVTHNSALVLPACLDSLAGSAGCRVIVVDNGSTDNTASIVREYPHVVFLPLQDNTGYGAANNRGLAKVESPFVLFINPDASFGDQNVLTRLLSFLDQHPQAAAVGPQLIRADGSVQPFAFGDDPSLVYMLRRAIYRLLLRRSIHDWATAIPRRVDWVAGTCLLARTGAVREVGGWDTAFFMYFEDSDLCRRLRQRGWEIWYDPSAHIVHFGGQTDYSDVRRRQMYYRSLLYYYRKHAGRPARIVLACLLRPYMWLTGMNR
jgi:N-acetylglucosaminyl-diphospho-decaprenol L-rhamnosyltransferase